MKIIACQQGSEAWLKARIGIPTASCFDKIMTPKTLKPSGQQDAYLARLLSEWFTGVPHADEGSQYMERGKALEARAAGEFALDHPEMTVTECGLCLRDDGLVGCSPDRLILDPVKEDGVLEIKVPSLETHTRYMLNPKELEDEYRSQVQGELYVTRADFAYLYSWSPAMPKVTVEIYPDTKYLAKLHEHIEAFLARLASEKAKIQDKRAAYHAAREAVEF